MVTHSSTNRPVQCLCMAERTGCPVLTDLWSYVLSPTCWQLMEVKPSQYSSQLTRRSETTLLKSRRSKPLRPISQYKRSLDNPIPSHYPEPPTLHPLPLPLPNPLEHISYLLHFHGLRQEQVHPASESPLLRCDIAQARDSHDRSSVAAARVFEAANGAGGFEAVHEGHVEVEEDDLRLWLFRGGRRGGCGLGT